MKIRTFACIFLCGAFGSYAKIAKPITELQLKAAQKGQKSEHLFLYQDRVSIVEKLFLAKEKILATYPLSTFSIQSSKSEEELKKYDTLEKSHYLCLNLSIACFIIFVFMIFFAVFTFEQNKSRTRFEKIWEACIIVVGVLCVLDVIAFVVLSIVTKRHDKDTLHLSLGDEKRTIEGKTSIYLKFKKELDKLQRGSK